MASILVQSLAESMTTLFLFTKSDIKTTVIPASLFAIAAAPMTDVSRLPHVIFWIWIHILQFDVSNQIFGYEEDAINKKDRPIPSGRITLNAARTLRWALLPLCIGISALYSIETAYASVAWAMLIFIYNEMHGHSKWIFRNLFYASGFACFEVGASLIAGSNRHALDAVGARAVIVSAGIFATTCHTQDFKDRNGDRAIGRQTIPILFPRISRWTVLFPMVTWSIGLAVIWKLDEVVAGLVIALASYVGGRYLHMKSVPDDQISFYWYNVWISIAHALPGYYRVRQL